MMGSGKTSASINYMNRHPEEKFMYVTPFLDEVARIVEYCPERKFKEPIRAGEGGAKLKEVKSLIRKGECIATTHALFSRFDTEAINLIKEQGYVLILDEEINVIDTKLVDGLDAKILSELVKKDEYGNYACVDLDYQGLAYRYKWACYMSEAEENSGNQKIIVWSLPIEVFKAFNEAFVMTYMFDSQILRCFFDYYDIEYDKLYIGEDADGDYCISKTPTEIKVPNLKDLIHIHDNEKHNLIGKRDYSLTKNWFVNSSNREKVGVLKKNISNYTKNITKAKANRILWTSFKRDKEKLTSNGFKKSYLFCNARACNGYSDRDVLIYPINIYLNPNIKLFFKGKGIEVDDDSYALSEMIQWIWRSAIRKGKEIWIYIPSRRMRNLLREWINEVSEGGEHYRK